MGIEIQGKGKREPNGRLSRKRSDRQKRNRDGLDKAEREMIAVGTEARIRVFGVKAHLSRDQLAGSAVGRLCLDGLLHPDDKKMGRIMADAAFIYEQDCRAHAIAVEAPQSPSAVDLNRVRGGNGDYDNVKFKAVAMSRYDGARAAVQEAQNAYGLRSNLFGALYHCVLMDRAPVNEAMMGSLREALNVLVRHYGLNGNARKAA